MFYFFHGTTFCAFASILETGRLIASHYLPSSLKSHIRINPETKYIYTNIYVDGLPLDDREYAGYGEVTLIIDPLVLKYHTCYFNKGWAKHTDNSIIMNDNVDTVLEYVTSSYKFPLITQHEALFERSISAKFIIGIICEPYVKPMARKYLDQYGYSYVKIFRRFPTLIG